MGLVLWLLAIAATLALTVVIGRRYAAYRAARLVECPDNKQVAAVRLAAGVATLGGPMRLAQCSRWPEKRDCGRECLHQIESAPEDCMVRTMVSRWYEGKSCAVCGTSFAHLDWFERKPGVVDAAGRARAWLDIEPEDAAEVMSSHKPLCFDCCVTTTFRQQHPELVIDNPWQPGRR